MTAPLVPGQPETNQGFDPTLDCYLSWLAYIELCRERLETTGQYPARGPWQKREPSP